MIIIFISAFNAEKTLCRAIDSILNQTYGDFALYILDNASFDQTGIIMQEYAAHDKRLYLLKNEVNRQGWNSIKVVQHALEQYQDDCYFCTLDADDEYKPDFLEKTLRLMQSDNLDIAACGTQFIAEETGKPINRTYSIPNDLLISRKEFIRHFPTYLQFMYTVWGKLYKMSLMRKCNFDNVTRVSYGADTIFAMEAFSHARRIGILGGTLHNYYISLKSVSNVLDDKRVISDQICCDFGLEYLRRVDASLPENQDHIYSVYANAIKNTAGLIARSQIDPLEKLRRFRDVFIHPHTQEILRRPSISNQYRLSLQAGVQQYILSIPEARTQEGFECLVDIFAAMQNLSDPIPATNWCDNELFNFLIAVRMKHSDLKAVSTLNRQIEKTLSQSPLLTGVTVDASIFLRDVVNAVLRNDLNAALDEIIRLLDVEIPSECVEAFILLGSNLSAAIENANVYIYFKKIWVSYLLDCSRDVEAREELDEFTRILPDDEDFAVLSKRLN
ncbi:MAG: glycosyltransferase family 2 protein [Desulfitobacterium sp.]